MDQSRMRTVCGSGTGQRGPCIVAEAYPEMRSQRLPGPRKELRRTRGRIVSDLGAQNPEVYDTMVYDGQPRLSTRGVYAALYGEPLTILLGVFSIRAGTAHMP